MRITRIIVAFLFFIMAVALLSFQSHDQKLKTSISWEDEFSSAEKEKITTWLTAVSRATSQTLGVYPFTINFYINRKSSHEPVPWAHTIRDGEQAVNFHVDPSFSLSDFQHDWTAAHEISHLSIPFVGRDNMWFSEGYASFWQWQILKNQGLFSEAEIKEKLQTKLAHVIGEYDVEETFVAHNKVLKSKRNYPAVYWGGACYFFKADAELRKNYNTSLQKVIQKYQQNGRLKDDDLNGVIASLDRISNSTVFIDLFKVFTTGSATEAVRGVELFF